MEKKEVTVQKSVRALLNADSEESESLKMKISVQDGKIQQMLLWSTICAVWSYLNLIIIITRIYASLHGKHMVLLAGSLACMFALIGVLIFITWKGMAYQPVPLHQASKVYLTHQARKLSGQRKLISWYLFEYAVLLGISGIFFLMDIKNGITVLFKLTAPLGAITYILGLYFIISFTRKIKKLQRLDKQVDRLIFMEKISNN